MDELDEPATDELDDPLTDELDDPLTDELEEDSLETMLLELEDIKAGALELDDPDAPPLTTFFEATLDGPHT